MSHRRAAGGPAKLAQVTLTNRRTFLVLGRHAIRVDAGKQAPRITAAEALRELRRDCQLAELRRLIETPSER